MEIVIMNEKQPVMFAGQAVGITEFSDKIWFVSFIQYDIGCFDDAQFYFADF
jgi:hypothetical protein